MTESRLALAGLEIAECCKNIIPGHTEDALLQQLQQLVPNYPVRLAMTSDKWYRLGGVADMTGQRIASDLIEWAERTYLECGQNLQTLIDYSIEQRLIATKQTGKTLYFVVQTGDQAEDFTVIEIDKTHEVSDRLLVNEEFPPMDLEELIDPLQPFPIEKFGFGHSRYAYRRKTDVKLFMEAVNERHPGVHPVQRFMNDWNRSSAGLKHHLSDYWLIKPSQNIGRFGEQIVNLEIISTTTHTLPDLQGYANKKGSALANQLAHFDRQAGYPFAWFFHMVNGLRVTPHYGEAVFRDISGEYAYLPERDAAVLRDWIVNPYR